MDQHDVIAIANRFIEELHGIESRQAGGVDGIVALFSEDARLANPLIELEGSRRIGRVEIEEFWKTYRASFDDIHSEFFDVMANERSIGLFWRSTGTHTGGAPLTYEGVSHLHLDEAGRIKEFKAFFDTRQVATVMQT